MSVWTLPNALTILRGLLIIPLLFFLQQPSWQLLAAAAGLWLLDLADGVLARHRGEVTTLGATLDSLVDKWSFLAVFVALVLWDVIPLWLGIWIGATQLLQLALAAIMAHQSKPRPATGIMFLVGLAFGISLFVSGIFQEILFWFAALASANHLLYYGRPLFRRRKAGKSQNRRIAALPGWRLYFASKLQHRGEALHAPWRIWTVANAVTCFRLFLGGLLLDELWSQHWNVAITLGALFLFLDFVDGHLARKTQTVSLFGKMLDVVGDKAVLLGVVIVLTLQGFFSVEVLGVVLLRYLFVGICAFLLFFIYKKPLPISWWSHVANVAFFLALIVPAPWWITLVIVLQLQQLLQYYHDTYRLMDYHHAHA